MLFKQVDAEIIDGVIPVIKIGDCTIPMGVRTNDIGLPFIHHIKSKKMVTLAKKVYEDKNGKVGSGCIVRPSCGNMRCINPDHMKVFNIINANSPTG